MKRSGKHRKNKQSFSTSDIAGRGGGGDIFPFETPEKLQKTGNDPLWPYPAVSHDIRRNFKFLLIFKILLKFSKTFKVFIIIFQIFNENFQNFLKFSKIKIKNLFML